MKLSVRVRIVFLLMVIVCSHSFSQSTWTNFRSGSLIIPMDNSKQNLISSQIAFNVKSYGLVNALLQNNIPVTWIIKDAKLKDETDFSVLASRLYPSTTAAALLDFKSGPFIIDSLWANIAAPIIASYGNSVAVYKAEASFTAPVRYELMFKPKIAVFTNGNSHGIHTKALRLAGFSSPAHFDSIPAQNFDALSCYTFGCEPHWSGGQSTVTNKVTAFLNAGGNFFAQCVGINAYEQFEHHHTTNGITYETTSAFQENNNIYSGTDQPLMQFEGNLTNAPTGTVVNYKNNGGTYQPLTQFLVKKSPSPAIGVADGDVVLSTRKTGSASIGGNVTYLGGHDYLKGTFDLLDLGLLGLDYARAGDVTWNNGLRVFYNAIFMPSTRPTTCNFVFAGEAKISTSISNVAPCLDDTLKYTILFTNAGPGTAHNILVKTLPTPAGLTYFSNSTVQGTYSNGTNNWDIGDLAPNATAQLTIRYKVVADGTYTLKAYNANLIAGNNFAEDTSSVVVITNQSSPVVTAPAAINAFTNTGCSANGVNLGTPVVTDACGIASITNNAPSGFPLGSTTVTWTVIDKSGNTVTTTQLVTVTDNVNPLITAPSNIVTTTNSGCTATGVNLGMPTTSDNCGVASVTNNAPAVFPLGTTTVTWTVTDNSGNTAIAGQTVTVTDNQNPVITAPANVTTTTNSGCTATGVNLGTPTTSDNCGVASVTNNAPTTFSLGTTTVIWTVTDNSGNTSTASQAVTVTDNQNPVITAPANVTTTTNSGCTATGVNLGTPTTSDNCSVASVTNNAPSVYPLGTTNVIWTVTDNSGNSATVIQTVTVSDNENPTISAPANITVFPIASCDTSGLNLGTPTTSDNCTVASVTNNAPSIFPSGTTTVIWTVTDNSGNTATANQTVSVIDNQNPTITAPANVTTTTNSGCTATGVNLGTPITSDNCVIASVTNNAPATFPLGTTTVTWTVTDNSGHSVTANQTVTVTDNQNPIITAPANISTTTNSGCTATGVNLGTPTTSDNCGVASVTNNAPSVYPLGTTNITWTVTDNSGNTATVIQTVTITDSEDPTITTPADISVFPTTSCDTSGLNLGTPTTSDNCGVVSVANNAPATFPLGTTTVIWTVTDNSGNTATANQIVTVIDNQNPTTTAPANISVFVVSGCDTTLSLGTPMTSDNCTIASVTNNAPATFPLGTTTVTWTVTDNSGNTVTANQTVTVTDNQNPIITAPANIITTTNSGCTTTGVNLGTSTTSDNCTVVTTTNDAPSVFPLGTTNVTWTVTDNSGNTATVIQTVTVTDSEDPTITAPASITVFPTTSCDTSGLNLGTPSTSDNCGVASVTNNAPIVFPLGTTTVVWTVTDNSGNTATANQIISVIDNQNPTITAPADVSTPTNSGCTATGVNLGTPTTSDNCAIASVTNNAPTTFPLGTTSVTWTVTDNSGNTNSTTQIVTIVDSEVPVISNCNDTIKSCEALVSFQLPTAVDNCTLASLNQTDLTGLTSGSNFPDGYTILQYEAIDLAGNQSVCAKVIYKIQIPELPNAGEDQTVYAGETTLNASPGVLGIGQWSVLEGAATVANETDPKSSVSGLQKGNALLAWSVSNEGCSGGMDTMIITFVDLNIPNAFSPDGDQMNDFFEIKGIENYSPAQMVITNRWGEVVYESTNYLNDWSAQSKNGQELTNDTYYYQLILSDKSEFSGFVIVKRK